MRHQLRGLTLAEVLLTVFVVFLVMGVACQLLVEYSALLKDSQAKASALSGLQVAEQQILDDLRQAVSVQQPPAGATTPGTRFMRIDPEAAWLPASLPPTLPASWDPHDPASLVQVNYTVNDQQLWRQVGTAPAFSLAERVGGLEVTALASGYEVKLSLIETHRVLVLRGTCAPVKL